MNTYRVNLDVEIDVTANSKEEAEQKAYQEIGNIEDKIGIYFQSYTVFADGVELINSNVDKKCFGCGKYNIGGSNDELCPKCLADWKQKYDERHQEQ